MKSASKKVIRIVLFFILGILSGLVAKYADTVSSDGIIGNLINIISQISSRIGVWAFIATIIAAWSGNPEEGAIRVLLFFAGMLLSYYIYSMKLFNFFPAYYFIRWGLIALSTPLAAYAVWFSRKNGWFAAFCAGVPVGLLLSEGYTFIYTFSPVQGFELIAAVILFCILPEKKSLYQYLKILIFALLSSILLVRINLFSYIIGGL